MHSVPSILCNPGLPGRHNVFKLYTSGSVSSMNENTTSIIVNRFLPTVGVRRISFRKIQSKLPQPAAGKMRIKSYQGWSVTVTAVWNEDELGRRVMAPPAVYDLSQAGIDVDDDVGGDAHGDAHNGQARNDLDDLPIDKQRVTEPEHDNQCRGTHGIGLRSLDRHSASLARRVRAELSEMRLKSRPRQDHAYYAVFYSMLSILYSIWLVSCAPITYSGLCFLSDV
ncbi:hypothetical protein FN846DRAFT_889660 [Sphaerosporella brunnea]|uniref:Uncharacterized protein n=1 Tax=Sphaerosporella brunnea TaxID=1250544 RepID=A0A5J5EZQ0_9PEZI|nr:hypothetical protein FN846DRAFT_889660 [Sphaerosporella brunnea]